MPNEFSYLHIIVVGGIVFYEATTFGNSAGVVLGNNH